MKRLFVFALLWCMAASAIALSCYDVQYTTNPNGNSPYAGQIVTVQAYVVAPRYYTGTGSTNYGFVLGDAGGGPWSGLLAFSPLYSFQLGDFVEVTGTVIEYYGFTEISPVTSAVLISSSHPPVPATHISTGQLMDPVNAEQWESVFVRVDNVQVAAIPNNYNEFYV
ncbi:MAG: hypothetical protein U1B83_10720, partial [Candidatus Cloacimonadaceae bacterium]|nr:hypothetical protein [Candidatus Cloacimonadaceae bacterium]